MKVLILAALAFGYSMAWAQETMNSECLIYANQQFMDYGSYGSDADGAPARFDTDGKLIITSPEKVISRSTTDGVETIVYKAITAPGGMSSYSKKGSWETTQPTIVIKRDSSGKVLSISKKLDQAKLEEYQKLNKQYPGQPAMETPRSFDTEFSYKGNDCSISQSITVSSKDLKGKEQVARVHFDKKFCDELAPIVNTIGSQNASQCANLVNKAIAQFQQREVELKKEGKVMSIGLYGSSMEADTSETENTNFHMGAAIASCAMHSHLTQMGGMGTYGEYNPSINPYVGNKSRSGKTEFRNTQKQETKNAKPTAK